MTVGPESRTNSPDSMAVRPDQRGFPETLDTDRLILRRYSAHHSAAILQIVAENREQLIREFAQLASLRSLYDAQAFVAEKRKQWRLAKTFAYGIWRKVPEQLIGQIQVKNIAWDIPSAELGYFIGRASQRQHYASEAIKKQLQTAFEQMQFQRLFLRILPSNHASLRLAEKLGFQQEGLHRNAFRCGLGELHDVYYLAMLRQDWPPR
jgi:RimJ/RimL family protein N-acetyltransferase